ncbi:histone lysine demethylase PHF8-like [Trichosurus vulpecula]|uniref:histone lysine demethylase PHF8-like n=1 Tax=Trichosurus vulpecula TaxID=9337 RepID=UPI00186B44A9|nr:histone lysine demethylase PHF8-like [Trichosurus vulpecula]
MASVPVYCLCQLPYDITRFMIECDLCEQWFHGSCVGVEEDKAEDIDLYHCPNCEILHGPSVMKNYQRVPTVQELIVNKEVAKMEQTGSPIQELQPKTFHSNKKVNDFTTSRKSKAKLKALTKAQPKLTTNEKFDLDSEEELKIKETLQKEKNLTSKKKLPKFRQKVLRAIPCSDPNRILEPGEVDFDVEENYIKEENIEDGLEAKVESTSGACGILDLLKASRLIGGPDYVGRSKAPVSPGTLEAIQGMLCMANLQPVSSLPPASSFQAWWAPEEYSGSSDSTSEKGGDPPVSQEAMKKQAVKQLATHSKKSEKEEVNTHKPENLGNSFKDEYIHLESDGDDSVSKLRPKKKKSAGDVPWISKARVVPSLPKRDRTVKEGTVVSSMETRLTGTVEKLAQQEPFWASLSDHKYSAQPKMFGIAQVKQSFTPEVPGVFLPQERPSVSSHGDQMTQGERPKKGQATAKQRLGRILKIHRNGKLVL